MAAACGARLERPKTVCRPQATIMLKAGLTLFVHLSPVMAADDLSIFAMLKSRLSYLADRQQVIAQNVANSDTPSFTPKDLKPFALPGHGGALALAPVTPALTSPMHLAAPTTAAAAAKPVDSPDSETTLNGNSVVLEDEMMKMSQARMDYDAAVAFYQQSMLLLTTAAKTTTQ
jgi:flagellar basal-body rod protein FlgB